MDEQILEVLKDIRTEAKTTNARLESLEGRVDTTNTRLESLDGRVEFMDKRVTRGFEDLSQRLDRHVDRMDDLSRRQIESEIRLSTEVLSLADVTRDVRDLLARKLDDHAAVIDHEERIRSLEDRIADKNVEP